MTREFILRRADIEGEWFSLSSSDFSKVLMPASKDAHGVDGDGPYRIEVENSTLSFYHDDPGIHVVCTGPISDASLSNILREILDQIESATGETGRVVAL